MTKGSGDICDDDLLELLNNTGKILLKCTGSLQTLHI